MTVNETLLIAEITEAETRYRLRFAREISEAAGRREYERGFDAGYATAISDVKAAQHGIVRDLELLGRRWHLCCRRCRLAGHRAGCPDCEDRGRSSFGQPHRHDLAGREAV